MTVSVLWVPGAGKADVSKWKFPERADALFFADEWHVLPMKRSRKNPRYYYYHEKYFLDREEALKELREGIDLVSYI